MNNQEHQADISQKIEAVNDDIYEYTRLELVPPQKLIRRRAGLRARMTRLQRELL